MLKNVLLKPYYFLRFQYHFWKLKKAEKKNKRAKNAEREPEKPSVIEVSSE